jgi:hypothetical protein
MDKGIKEYLAGIEEIEKTLFSLGFEKYSFQHKTNVYNIEYKRSETLVQFRFGPSDWDTEMIICTSKGKFILYQLLQIPAVSKWFYENRYVQKGGRDVKAELHYHVELLKISLPLIE